MSYQFCPYCGNKTLVKKFCVYCGNQLLNTNICLYCYASIPINATFCPFCGHSDSHSQSNNALKDSSHLNWISVNFRLAILVIFLLSAYSLTQLMIGSVFLFFFPADFTSDDNYAFFSLVIMLVSSVLLIVILIKWLPLSSREKRLEKSEVQILSLLVIILIVSVSFIEILVTLTDLGLDLINVDPSLSSP
ncbi:MAG: zinc ribbon domain-containing protein, partial [Candidatus Hodarchaeota archaeon]